ncbi:MAG: DNA polymerase III subunit delta [Verrucomicrobia bacterium]|nr:DNA polymerase III subunit delta [Verrucomicrobiota bacterium]MBV8485637.1 DNA polymerase III subunit delta [Verrucomicrobiota bacterium]
MATQRKPKSQAGANTRFVGVVGSDEGAVKKRAHELAAELAPKDAGDFGVDLLDGAVENTDQAVTRIHETVQAIQTLPFFGSEKLVWLKDVNFLGDSAVGRSAQVQTALEQLKEILSDGLPSDVTVLLSATEVDKRRSFYKAISKLGRFEQFDRIDTSKSGWEEAVEGMAQHMAGQRALRFQPDALEAFARLAGADSRQVENEIEKIDLFLSSDVAESSQLQQSREISLEVVRRLVAKTATGVIWELGNAIARRNLSEALDLLQQLLFQGETAMGILFAAIIPTMRNLLAAKELCDSNGLRPPQAPFQFGTMINRLPESSVSFLPRKKDGSINTYALGLAACEIHRFSIEELRQGLKDCLAANIRLVTTQLEPKLILSDLLVKLLA